jgi:hypothetical protein
MYALSKLPVGEGVRPEDVNQADAERGRRELEERIARTRVDRPAAPVQSRIVIPDFDSDTRDPGLFGVGKKKGGKVSSGSKTASASKRGDGIAQRGKTRGRMV